MSILTRTCVKQWAWFMALWLGGLLFAMALAYPIKLLILFL